MDFLIVFAAKYLIFLIGLAWAASLLQIPKSRGKFYIVFILTAFILAIVGSKILGLLFYNPRPFVVENIVPLVMHEADNGFPSGHTLFSMMFATTSFSYNRKLGIILGILAVVVGISRVLAHVHHAVDISGSIGLTIGATYLAWILLKKYLKKI